MNLNDPELTNKEHLKVAQVAIMGFRNIVNVSEGDLDYIYWRLDQWEDSIKAALAK